MDFRRSRKPPVGSDGDERQVKLWGLWALDTSFVAYGGAGWPPVERSKSRWLRVPATKYKNPANQPRWRGFAVCAHRFDRAHWPQGSARRGQIGDKFTASTI